jgi:serine/threonine protein kinase
MSEPQPQPRQETPDNRLPAGAADWEAFYRDYRKPGYVSGFEITSKLGGGMSGLVFRARKQSIGKDYAIKFLQVDDSEVRRAVLAELEQVQYFAQIDHPNLVSIEDRGEVDGIPFLVMSFAGTETLRDRMPAGGKLPGPAERDELLRWFLQCCRGLGALHERSLVHFDIKPANVFLKGAVARLGDYGLSKLITHSRGSLSMGRGTPYYMAPEMLQRRGDHRSDIYSLGVMLYEMLCGKVPFTGDSEWEVLKQHEQKAPDLPSHLSALERAVLQRCLQKDPAARYQSVLDVIAAFGVTASGAQLSRAAAPAVPPSATRPQPPPLPGKPPPPLRPTPPPLPRARPRAKPRSPVPILLGLALLASLVIASLLPVRASRNESRVAGTRAAAPAPAESLAGQLEQFVAGVQRSARIAVQRQRPPQLRPLDPAEVAAPADFALYRDQLQQLADAPSFTVGHAKKLERLGRPAVLAAVAMLQDYDYQDLRHCRRAANLHGFLGHALAIDGLGVEASGFDPTPSESCRFQVMADGWRRFAEQFVCDDGRFDAVLQARGMSAVGVRR